MVLTRFKLILIFILLLLTININFVYANTVIVKVIPEKSHIKIEVCPTSGSPLDCIEKYTDENGVAIFNLSPGVYLAQIYLPSNYELGYWEVNGAIQILCSPNQNPVYINVSGDGELKAYLKYKQEIYLNIYIDTPVNKAPEIKIVSENETLYSGRVESLTFPLESLKIYDIYLEANYSFYSSDCLVKCNLKSVDIYGKTDILLRQLEDNYYHIKLKTYDSDINIYAKYECKKLYYLNIITNIEKAKICVASSSGKEKCVIVSNTTTTSLLLPKGYYNLKASSLIPNYNFSYWVINDINYYTNPVTYYLYFDTNVKVIFEKTPTGQPPKPNISLCKLRIDSTVPVTFRLLDLNTGETYEFETPIDLQLYCLHKYKVEFPTFIDNYRLVNILYNYLSDVKINISAGIIEFNLTTNGKIKAIYKKTISERNYTITISSYPISTIICITSLKSGKKICNKTPFTLELPEGWYSIYAQEYVNNYTFSQWIINDIPYYKNPIIYYLYFDTNVIAIYVPKPSVPPSPTNQTCRLSITSSPILVQFTLYDLTSGNKYSSTTPEELNLPCNHTYKLVFPTSLDSYYLSNINYANLDNVEINVTEGYIKFKLKTNGSTTAIYSSSPTIPEKYTLILHSRPEGAEICVKSVETGVEICNKTPFILKLPEGWYLIKAKENYNGLIFDHWTINGINYYKNPVLYYLWFDSEATAIYKVSTYNVKIISEPVNVYIKLEKNGNSIYYGYTPVVLGLSVGIYKIYYPKESDNYVFKSIKGIGSVKIIDNNTFEVLGHGEVILSYKLKPSIPTGKYCIRIITRFSNDKTVIKNEFNQTIATIIGNGKICDLPAGTYYLYTKLFEKEEYTRFYFKSWKIDNTYYYSVPLKLYLDRNVTIYKLYNVDYLLIVRAKIYNDGPISNLPVTINGNTYYTDSSGTVKVWIKEGTKVVVSVPKKYNNCTTPITTIEFIMTNPKEKIFVYFPTHYPNISTKEKKFGTISIIVLDQFNDIIYDNFEVYLFRANESKLYQKIAIENGKGIAYVEPGKYLLLVLFRYKNYTLSRILGCDNYTGITRCYISVKPNKTRKIVIYYIYSPETIILYRLTLELLDQISNKRINYAYGQICPLNILYNKCSNFEIKNGILTMYLQKGKYLLKIYAPGYIAKEVYVDLTKSSVYKIIYLIPLKPPTSENRTTKENVTTKFEVYILTYPNKEVRIYSYPSMVLLYKLKSDSEGKLKIKLLPGIYLFEVDSIRKVVSVYNNIGIILKEIKFNKTPIQTKKERKYRVIICVYRDSTPLKYIGIKIIKKIYTYAFNATNSSGCATFYLNPGNYTVVIDSYNKSIVVDRNKIIKIKLPKPEQKMCDIAIILLIITIGIIILIRFYIEKRLSW